MLRGLPPAQTKKTLAEILDRAQDGAPADAAGRHARRAEPRGRLRQARSTQSIPRWPKASARVLYPFFLEGVAGDPKLNQSDGLHPTAAGVAVIVARILPSVEALLQRAKAR